MPAGMVSPIVVDVFRLIIGIVFLWWGADWLVKNASRFSTSIGVSPIIVGLSVVSLGTSMPELVVSVLAAIHKSPGLSVGNIIGSNIANIGLILGVGAIIRPFDVKKSWVKREVPFMLGVTFVFAAVTFLGHALSPTDGIILLGLLVFFVYTLYSYAVREASEFRKMQAEILENSPEQYIEVSNLQRVKYLVLAIAGLGILILGSEWTVRAGRNIAVALGVSDMIIGLTMVAVGTSLPELATTIVGSIKKETDIVVGNVIGSNIFNLLLIGGIIAIIRPMQLEKSLLIFNLPALILFSVIVLPIMRLKFNVQRYEGYLLVALYALFILLTFIV